MKRAIWSILFLVAFGPPLFAQLPSAHYRPEQPRWSVLSIGGPLTRGIAVTGRAVGWSLERPHCSVSVSAHLGNGGGYAIGIAYLTRSIGPGTSAIHEIRQTGFDLPFPFDGWITLFEGLELEAGDYWLIVAKPPEKTFSSINWTMANPMRLKMSSAVRYIGTTSYTYDSDVAEYLPASNFGPKYEPYGFEIEVTGNEVPIGHKH